MVRTCRLAPTMATLILVPWEFWLSCKNWDWGETPIFAFPRRECVELRGEGESLVGSRALTRWTSGLIQSVQASLAYHYKTLSPRLRRTVVPCQRWKKIATHTLPVLTLLPFARLCTAIGGWLSRHNRALFTCIILRECKPVFRELMLHWCLVAMGPGLRPWHKGMTFLFSHIVTYWVDTNYPAFRSTNLAATYWAGVKPSPFMWGIFWSGCRLLWDFSTKRLDAGGGNVKGGESWTMGPP